MLRNYKDKEDIPKILYSYISQRVLPCSEVLHGKMAKLSEDVTDSKALLRTDKFFLTNEFDWSQ